MADVLFSQFDVASITTGESLGLNTSQLDVEVVFNIPAEEVEISQYDVSALTTSPAVPVDVSQFDIEVIYRGRVEDPSIRLWPFILDGHDFVVARLGMQSTLLIDVTTRQFYVWGSGDGDLWRAYDGTNWQGGAKLGAGYGTNIVVGDDGNGSLYFLSPEQDTDDDALQGDEVPRVFRREAMGQLLTKGYASMPNYSVELLGSIGQLSDPTLTSVSLYISDNRGVSYVDCGAITAPEGDYHTRLNWLSLGSFTAPGRLFKIVDYGALRRIDSLDTPGGD